MELAPLQYSASVEATELMTEAIKGEEFRASDHIVVVYEATS